MSFLTTCLRPAAWAIVLVALTGSRASAQLDRLYPVTGSSVTGKVTDIQRDGVTIQVGSANQDYRIDQIRKLTFEGDPAGLTRGRDLALEGQYQSAVDQLKQVNVKDISREYVAADAIFYRIMVDARLALAGQGDKDAAMKNLQQFASRYKENYHFYDAAELYGDLQLSGGGFEAASRSFSALLNSKVPLVAARGKYLMSTALLREGKSEEAITGFDQVIAASLGTTEGARLQTMARAGRAVALARSGQGQQALEETNQLIATLSPEDTGLAARIYNARGAAYEALGDDEAALLAYLHTHLLFSSVVEADAEALSRMVNLWPKVGKPENGAEARQELQTRYPGWSG